MFAVYRELHCPPVAAMALAARCRAFLKYGELKTWIATLMAHGPPVGLAKGSWVISTKRLVATHQAARRLVPVVGPRGQKRQRLELLEDALARAVHQLQFTVFLLQSGRPSRQPTKRRPLARTWRACS